MVLTGFFCMDKRHEVRGCNECGKIVLESKQDKRLRPYPLYNSFGAEGDPF